MAKTPTGNVAEMPPGARALSRLRQWIRSGRFPGGARLPSEQSLADELTVSRGTVRGALEKLAGEGLVKRRKGRGCMVLRGAERGAGAVSPLMSRTVGLLTVYPTDMWHDRLSGWMEAIEIGAMEALTRAGLHSLTLHPDGLDEAGVGRLLDDRPLGIIVTHAVGESDWGLDLARRLMDGGVRIVVNGDRPEFAGCDRVASDHEAGAYELTRWLAAQGRRRILRVWTANFGDYWLKARDRGYERALREAGLKPLPPVHVKGLLRSPEPDREAFDIQARQFAGYLVDHLSPDDGADAVMATTDAEAFPIAAACRLLGREPNRGVALVGYDGNWSSCPEREWEPAAPLASVDKLNHQTGERMVGLLLDRADEARRVLVRPELVIVDGGARS